MICSACADAANRRAPKSEHCGDPKYMCGHRTDKYRTTPPRELPCEAGPDDEPCTASIKDYSGTHWHCALTAGHYDETDEPDAYAEPPHPGGWHAASRTAPTHVVWADFADGATPHTDATKD